VLPPDLNVSERSFTVDYEVDEETRKRRRQRNTAYAQVRFGLGAIKGLGDAALEAILETRRDKGAFTSLFQFCEQVPLQKINRKVLEVLIKSGALDRFGKNRNQHFASIERAIDSASGLQKDARVGQANMFAMFSPEAGASGIEEKYPDLAEWPEKELLAFERESIGFYLSGHPLDRYAADAKRLGTLPTVDLVNQTHNSEVHVVGIVAALRERMLKSGNGRWAVVTLEDNFGQCEVLAFSRVYEEAEALLKSGEPLLLKGRALLDDIDDEGKQRTPKMRAESVESLAEAQIARTRVLDVLVEFPAKSQAESAATWSEGLPDTDDLDEEATQRLLANLRTTLSSYPGEKPVRIHLDMPAGYRVTIRCGEDMKVHPTEELLMDLERVKGVEKATRR
jgi:DNA polymerase-3 subunit alpha